MVGDLIDLIIDLTSSRKPVLPIVTPGSPLLAARDCS
jgi:hypothetical protein